MAAMGVLCSPLIMPILVNRQAGKRKMTQEPVELPPPQKSLVRSRIIAFVSTIVLLVVVLVSALQIPWTSSKLFYSGIEISAMLIAFMIGAVALIHYYSDRTNLFLFIGTGFLGAAFLDAYYMLATSTVLAQYYASDLELLIPWSWIASRFFISLFLCLSMFAWAREQRGGTKKRIPATTVYAIALGLTLLCFFFFFFIPLPEAYYTSLLYHRPEEFVPAALFLVALIGYLRLGNWKRDDFEFWLVMFLIVSVMLQAFIMSLSAKLFDTMFALSYTLKTISYIFILIGLLKSMLARFKLSIENAKKYKHYAAKLEYSNNELQQFAYIASHDLREPLRKIQTFSTFLNDECGKNLTDDGKDYLKRIIAAVKRMDALIIGLLHYSRVTTKAEPFKKINLQHVLEGVLSDLENRIQKTHATIDVDLQWKTIEADPLQMRQLLQNLIANALKFHKKNETPHINISSKALNKKEDDLKPTFCEITIKDFGIGFKEKYIERIFGVFQRLHGRNEYEGSGIGLSICKKIVNRHNGEIKVSSKTDVGSTFTVLLPITKEEHVDE